MPCARVSEFAVSVGANRTLPRTHRRVRRSHVVSAFCPYNRRAPQLPTAFSKARATSPRAGSSANPERRRKPTKFQSKFVDFAFLFFGDLKNNFIPIYFGSRNCWAANPAPQTKSSFALPRGVPLKRVPSLGVHRNSGGAFRKATGCAPGRQANKQTRPAVGLRFSLRVLSRDGGVVTAKPGAWWRVDVPRARCAFVRVIQIRLKFEAACALRLPSAGRVSPPRPATTNFVQKKYLVLERYTSTRRRAARAISDRQGRRSST